MRKGWSRSANTQNRRKKNFVSLHSRLTPLLPAAIYVYVRDVAARSVPTKKFNLLDTATFDWK